MGASTLRLGLANRRFIAVESSVAANPAAPQSDRGVVCMMKGADMERDAAAAAAPGGKGGTTRGPAPSTTLVGGLSLREMDCDCEKKAMRCCSCSHDGVGGEDWRGCMAIQHTQTHTHTQVRESGLHQVS